VRLLQSILKMHKRDCRNHLSVSDILIEKKLVFYSMILLD